MKNKCYSVRLKSLVLITDKAYKAEGFDGSEAILPISQVFGRDLEVKKTKAYWISAWILEKKNLQYSTKKIGWFDKAKGIMRIYRNIPPKKQPIMSTINKDLER